MKLNGLFPECLLDFNLGGVLMDAQYVVIIAFFAVCQNDVLVIRRAALSSEALPFAWNMLHSVIVGLRIHPIDGKSAAQPVT
jgi:hypothetical protein